MLNATYVVMLFLSLLSAFRSKRKKAALNAENVETSSAGEFDFSLTDYCFPSKSPLTSSVIPFSNCGRHWNN